MIGSEALLIKEQQHCWSLKEESLRSCGDEGTVCTPTTVNAAKVICTSAELWAH
jgi:hypothetical protein